MYQLGVVIYKKIKPLTFFGAGFGCGGGKAFCCCQSQGSAIAYPANTLSSSSPSTTQLRPQNSNSSQSPSQPSQLQYSPLGPAFALSVRVARRAMVQKASSQNKQALPITKVLNLHQEDNAQEVSSHPYTKMLSSSNRSPFPTT